MKSKSENINIYYRDGILPTIVFIELNRRKELGFNGID
jgi:hypothetical protein